MRTGFLVAALTALPVAFSTQAAAEVTLDTQYTCSDKAAGELYDARAAGDGAQFDARLSEAIAAGECSIVKAEANAEAVAEPEAEPAAEPKAGAKSSGTPHKVKPPPPQRQRTAQRETRERNFPPRWLFLPRR